MAQYDTDPSAGLRPYFGGQNPEYQIMQTLIEKIEQARKIDLAVSFLMTSGVRLILPALKRAAERGVPIRILCGSTLNITEPTALIILFNELREQAELYFYADTNTSFHPKCWIFTFEKHREVLIGSSNLSKSGITTGIEWNVLISSLQDQTSLDRIQKHFDGMIAHEARRLDEEAIEIYKASWIRPAAIRSNLPQEPEDSRQTGPDPSDQTGQMNQEHPASQTAQAAHDSDPDPASFLPALIEHGSHGIVPNPVQIEALYALDQTRKNGNDRALVQAATGIGKTVLAAFDSLSFSRVLFVAHRTEILDQAEKTFASVRPEASAGRIQGERKDRDQQILFASVFTLASEGYLNPDFLDPEAFDYIIVDEFHHAAASSYQKVLNYFRPKFLLGLSATPYRLDGKDLYGICRWNVPYKIDFFQAINRDILCPFHYYGLYDDSDYSGLRMLNGRYQAADLEALYASNKTRNRTILRNYLKHASKKAIGFCASKNHALQMARFFNEQGIASAAVFSGTVTEEHQLDRYDAIRQLKSGKLKVIFCVDLFNEGFDLPDLDLVMFLRPTDSVTVFLQQLGRGLRKSAGKQFLTVLDFIGNYRSARLGPSLLLKNGSVPLQVMPAGSALLPAGCQMDFDLELLDLYKEMTKKLNDLRTVLLKQFWQLKRDLGHVPQRMEFYRSLDEDLLASIQKKSALNPFRGYLGFLKSVGEISVRQEEIRESAAGRFIHMIETTNMSRIYKMPVLLSFLDHDRILREVDEQRVLQVWKEFFSSSENWRDLGSRKMTFEEYQKISDRAHLSNIRKNPVTFLKKSSGEFFEESDSEDVLLRLSDELAPWLSDPEFVRQVREALLWRMEDYFSRRMQKQDLLLQA